MVPCFFVAALTSALAADVSGALAASQSSSSRNARIDNGVSASTGPADLPHSAVVAKTTVDRLEAMATKMSEVSARIDNSSLRTSEFALGTVLATGFINLLIQIWFMKHQRDLNKDLSKTQISSSFVEWQLKQLSELYGPLRALLGESNAMYRQMNDALVRADRYRFRYFEAKDLDFDDKEFQIKLGNDWVRFRTVMHIEEVYGKDYGIEPYFDDVTSIGGQIVDLIKEKAGYARSDQDDLVGVMGKYLAHHSVLRRIHERVKNGGGACGAEKVDDSAAFPILLPKLVNEGFVKLNKALSDWQSQGAQVVV